MFLVCFMLCFLFHAGRAERPAVYLSGFWMPLFINSVGAQYRIPAKLDGNANTSLIHGNTPAFIPGHHPQQNSPTIHFRRGTVSATSSTTSAQTSVPANPNNAPDQESPAFDC